MNILLRNANVPGEYSLVSDSKKRVTAFTVFQSASEPGKVETRIDATTDIDPSAGRVTCAAMCSRSDVHAVVVGHDDGRLYFPFTQYTTSLGEVSCDAVAWNPVYHHMVAASLANEHVVIHDVAQVVTAVSAATTSPADVESLKLNEDRVIGGVAALEWMPTMPQNLVAASPSKTTPLMLDSRCKHLFNFGGEAEGRETASRKKDKGVNAAAVSCIACHPLMPYIATSNNEGRRSSVVLWDARNPGKPLHRRACDEAFSCLQWYPSVNDIVLAASCREEQWMRIMRFTPVASNDLAPDDGYHSSFMSTAGTSTADTNNADPYRSFRATDRNKVRNNYVFNQFAWLTLASPSQHADFNRGAAAHRSTAALPASSMGHRSNVTDQVCQLGIGSADAVVGVTPGGDLNIVTLRASPVVSWISATKVLAAFEGTLMVTSPVAKPNEQYVNDVAFRTRQRLKEGFGIDPVVNQRVARRFGDRPLEDLFRYVAVFRDLNLPAPRRFPGVIDLIRNEVNLPELRPRPATRIAAYNSLSPARQLVLQLMGWVADEAVWSASGGGDAAWIAHVAACDEEAFERLVAIKIFLGAIDQAVEMLLTRSALDGASRTYAPLATVLQTLRPGPSVPWTERTTVALCGTLNFWLSIAVNFVANFWPSRAVPGGDSIVIDKRIPVTDRIALGAALVADTAALLLDLQAFEKSLLDDLRPTVFILAGLNAKSVPWMQRIVDCKGDVQLAACLFAWVCVPKDVISPQWTEWDRTYRNLLNDWGLHIDRGEYDVSRKKMAVAMLESGGRPGGAAAGGGGGGAPSAAGGGTAVMSKPPPKLLVELRCSCGQALHDTAPTKSQGTFGGRAGQQAAPQRMHCPNPLCKSGSGIPLCAVCAKKMEPRGSDVPIDRWFVWCTRCLHGGHMVHIGEWFRKHKKCPIEDCNCHCQLGDGSLSNIGGGAAALDAQAGLF